MNDLYSDPAARYAKIFTAAHSSRPAAFHKRFLPNYSPTSLTDVPAIAQELGLGHVLIKDESNRLGLPAFKILGASWATFVVLCERFGLDPDSASLGDIRVLCNKQPVSLWAATDGNHGRALARVASIIGATSKIYVPWFITERSKAFIASEGAQITQVHGDYDETVQTAAKECAESESSCAFLIQDTSWEGYEYVPLQTSIGYSTLFKEIDEQLSEAGLGTPSLIVVPVEVGSLAHAAVFHYRAGTSPIPPSILTVEPEVASCLLTSLKAGESITVVGGKTIMPGLNCNTVSLIAWPDLKACIDLATAISDAEADKAVNDLAELGISSGPCGAATIAALRRIKGSLPALGEKDVVVVISSEGSEVYLGPDPSVRT
ncbi:pyridoxal-phosphate-dependent enzyme, putative [Rhizoctonia solani AG-3 Rhs1AP]|uniref:Pyridoxal-phosphate-dependent enzyme, putative n=2 Tax=Rhizoctonia solani AG-3 TaxID=1086053 RepID=A0A0A1UK93_9AGAM|nr:pyridoxal-phosphate-dependent enzyme, putative [Rhizoctonia solani AG-3 Rhs1AP]KEP51501.1 putative pyridoxal-phosphate-dependent enzyme [Rhizoctonia solani 123E]